MEGVHTLSGFLGALSSAIPGSYSLTLTLAVFSLIIIFFAVFVFYFYKFLAQKNFIKLDLAKLCPDVFPKSVTISSNTFSIMLLDGDTAKLHQCFSGRSIEESITSLLEGDSESI